MGAESLKAGRSTQNGLTSSLCTLAPHRADAHTCITLAQAARRHTAEADTYPLCFSSSWVPQCSQGPSVEGEGWAVAGFALCIVTPFAPTQRELGDPSRRLHPFQRQSPLNPGAPEVPVLPQPHWAHRQPSRCPSLFL